MTISPNARRLVLLGVALTLTLTSAAWLFFGAHEPAAAPAAPVKALVTGTAPVPATGPATASAPAPADTQRRVAPAAGSPSPAAAPATRAAARTVVAAPRPVAQPRRSLPSTATIEREVFAYGGSGRRDPFRPLIATSEIRPLPSELRLVAVVYDPRGPGSVAILRDSVAKKQHRVRHGQLLGRMRVAQIRQKQVVFTIEELGFSRQEILGLQDSTATRLP